MTRLWSMTMAVLASFTPAAAVDRLEVIDLPTGFAPEGIVIGHPWEAYVGSLADGSIWMGNLKTGEGEVVIDSPGEGASSAGLAYDKRSDYLYVCGGLGGTARIYDALYDLVLEVTLGNTDGTSFVNDVIVTDDYAYFTDSFQAQFYKVPLNNHGELMDGEDTVGTTITYGADFEVIEGSFNANGIVASDDGSMLIVANTALSTLFLVDSVTGDASAIDLGDDVVTGDGLLRRRNTLWVCQNGSGGTSPQQIFEVSLSADWTCGSVADRVLVSDNFSVPTTIDRQYNGIYAVNAKFGTPAEDMPTTAYEIVRVDRDEGEVVCSA